MQATKAETFPKNINIKLKHPEKQTKLEHTSGQQLERPHRMRAHNVEKPEKWPAASQ